MFGRNAVLKKLWVPGTKVGIEAVTLVIEV